MYALGLYCFFEIAPLGLLFVAVWTVYRPATARLPIMACVIVLLLVWWPYLGYEAGRAGLDVRSFVTGSAGVGLDGVNTSGPRTHAIGTPSSLTRGLLMNYARG